MKLSFSTLGCPRWSWQDITATARDLSYDGIEVRGVGTDISAPTIPQFAETAIPVTLAGLKRMNLAIPCLASECTIHQRDAQARTSSEVAAYVKLAKALGVPYIRVMAAPAVPQPVGAVDVGFVKEEAQRLGELASRSDITLLLETHGVWSDSVKLTRLLEDIASPNVQALWDVHHPFRYNGENPQVTLDALGKYIKHVHLKDSKMEGGSVRYTLPGYGDVPFLEAAGLLNQNGYDGFYSLEWVKRWDLTLEEPGVVFAHFANLMRTLG